MTDSDIGAGAPATDEDQYVVRLAMSINAGSPEEALIRFIDQLIEKGLRNWAYHVDDAETGAPIGTYSGYGEDVTERVRAMREEYVSTPAPPAAPSEVHIDDDDDLLELAEQLNAKR